jgi:hypothetical protein
VEKIIAAWLVVMEIVLGAAIVQYHRSIEQVRPLSQQIGLEDVLQEASSQS